MKNSQLEGLRVLMVGESWVKHTIHIKGFDQFSTVEYEEGAGDFLRSLDRSGADVTYIRAHEISQKFPKSKEEMDRFDVVVLSDIGANSFLLCDETFLRSELTVNRLQVLADFVEAGGGLVKVGGYMSFSGIDGKARFGMSPLAPVLPVEMLKTDDRVEVPEGLTANVVEPDHPVLGGSTSNWPPLLGYNQTIAKPGSRVVSEFNGDPLLVVGEYGAGRVVAFTSDLAPHWAPPEFIHWECYGQLWDGIVSWASQGSR